MKARKKDAVLSIYNIFVNLCAEDKNRKKECNILINKLYCQSGCS